MNRRISDLARELAEKNTRSIKSLAREMNVSEQFAEESTGTLTKEADLQYKIAETVIDRNAPRMAVRMRSLPEDAKQMADELDSACAKLEKSMQAWVQASDLAIKNLRDKRMAINSELSDVLKSIQDATGLASNLNKGDAMKTLADLATAGKALRDAYGDTGLVRLADAMLVLSEAAADGAK